MIIRYMRAGLKRLHVIIFLVLMASTILAYWPVLRCDFVNYDDPKYVLENPRIQEGLTPRAIQWALTTGHASNWHPVTWLSHMIDYQAFGLKALGPHLVNLVLHLSNVALLFALMELLTSSTWRSALVSALFALHPLHVESVAWVAERKDVLSTLFGFLCLILYARYAQGKKPPRKSLWYVGALVFYSLGLMSKPMLVTWPLLMLLLDFWPLGRLDVTALRWAAIGPLVREKVPFFVLSMASCVVTFIAQEQGGAVAPVDVVPLETRIQNAAVSYLSYVLKTIWPRDLAVIYPYAEAWPAWLVGVACVFLIGTSALVFYYRVRTPWVATGWFWYVGTLVPVIGLVQVGEQAMADRYAYIPSVGLFILTSWAFGFVCSRNAGLRRVVITIVFGVLAGFGTATWFQLGHWRDSVALFEHAATVTRDNAIAHGNLGLAWSARGDQQRAVTQFNKAISLSPHNANYWVNLGVALMELGRAEEALSKYRQALELNPNDADAHFNMGNALNPTLPLPADGKLAARDISEARAHYETALRLNPEFADAHVNMGNLEMDAGNHEEALRHYRVALEANPRSFSAWFNLANALGKGGSLSEAVLAYRRALELSPKDSRVRVRLGRMLGASGQATGAIRELQAGLAIDERDPVIHNELSTLLASLGDLDGAAQHLKEAVRLKPDAAELRANLGKVLFARQEVAASIVEYTEAVRLQPESPALHRDLAMALERSGAHREALQHFSKVTELDNENPIAHYELSVALARSADIANAVTHLRMALKLRPDWINALNNLAWFLATAASEPIRSPEEALVLAERAKELTRGTNPAVVSTLAAAYAAADRFPEATAAAKKVISAAEEQGMKSLADQTHARLKLYEAGKPFIETSPTSVP